MHVFFFMANIIFNSFSAKGNIEFFLQTMQIHVSQLVTSCLTCNQHCSRFSYKHIPKLLHEQIESANFEHGRVHFKQFGAERVM